MALMASRRAGEASSPFLTSLRDCSSFEASLTLAPNGTGYPSCCRWQMAKPSMGSSASLRSRLARRECPLTVSLIPRGRKGLSWRHNHVEHGRCPRLRKDRSVDAQAAVGIWDLSSPLLDLSNRQTPLSLKRPFPSVPTLFKPRRFFLSCRVPRRVGSRIRFLDRLLCIDGTNERDRWKRLPEQDETYCLYRQYLEGTDCRFGSTRQSCTRREISRSRIGRRGWRTEHRSRSSARSRTQDRRLASYWIGNGRDKE